MQTDVKNQNTPWAIFIKHIREKLKGKLWHEITIKPENIKFFNYHGIKLMKGDVAVPILNKCQ